MKKIGVITFHNSYNCGSMLESYAILKRMQEIDEDAEIIDFSSEGQVELYNAFFKNNSIKNIVKNTLLIPNIKKIKYNISKYEEFISGEDRYRSLDKLVKNSKEILEENKKNAEDRYKYYQSLVETNKE